MKKVEAESERHYRDRGEIRLSTHEYDASKSTVEMVLTSDKWKPKSDDETDVQKVSEMKIEHYWGLKELPKWFTTAKHKCVRLFWQIFLALLLQQYIKVTIHM